MSKDVFLSSTKMLLDLENLNNFLKAVQMDMITLQSSIKLQGQVIEFLTMSKSNQRKVLIDEQMRVERYWHNLIEEHINPIPSHLQDLYDFQKL
jgi:hypothetical protein